MKKIVISPFASVVTFMTLLTVTMNAQPAQATICVSPKNESERVICGSAMLKIIEDLISKSYFEKKATLSPMEQQEIERDQKLWRSLLKNCKSDKNCLRDAFNQRLTEIQDFDKVIEKKEDESEEEEEEEEESGTEEGSVSDKEDSKDTEEAEEADEEEDSKSTKAEGKESKVEPKTEGDNRSFIERFSDWLLPKKTNHQQVNEPKLTKSSALLAREGLSSNYLTHRSDLESSSEDSVAREKNDNEVSNSEKSDFETDSDLAKGEPIQDDSAAAVESEKAIATDDTETDETEEAKQVATTEEVEEEEQPSLMSRFFSFFSFGDDENKEAEVAVAEGGMPNAEMPKDAAEQTENGTSEELGDLASAIDEENLKVAESETVVETANPEISNPVTKHNVDMTRPASSIVAQKKGTEGKIKTAQKTAQLKTKMTTERPLLNGKTVQKPFVQQKQLSPDGKTSVQPVVQPTVSIFQRVARFFSVAPKNDDQVKTVVKVEDTSAVTQNAAPTNPPFAEKRVVQTEANTESEASDLEKKGLTKLAKPTAPATQIRTVVSKKATPKVRVETTTKVAPKKEPSPSLFNRIAGFFSSKPKGAVIAKPNLTEEATPDTKVAETGSDLGRYFVEQKKGFVEQKNTGTLENSQHPKDRAAHKASAAEDESESAGFEVEGNTPVIMRTQKNRVTQQRAKIRKAAKRRARVKRAKVLRSRKNRHSKKARKVAKKTVKKQARRRVVRSKKRPAVRGRSFSKVSNRRVTRKARQNSKVTHRQKFVARKQAVNYYAAEPRATRQRVIKQKARTQRARSKFVRRKAIRARSETVHGVKMKPRAKDVRATRVSVRKQRVQRFALVRRAKLKARSTLKQKVSNRRLRYAKYKAVHARRTRAKVTDTRRYYAPTSCQRCVSCRECKPKFRLKHHLREHY